MQLTVCLQMQMTFRSLAVQKDSFAALQQPRDVVDTAKLIESRIHWMQIEFQIEFQIHWMHGRSVPVDIL